MEESEFDSSPNSLTGSSEDISLHPTSFLESMFPDMEISLIEEILNGHDYDVKQTLEDLLPLSVISTQYFSLLSQIFKMLQHLENGKNNKIKNNRHLKKLNKQQYHNLIRPALYLNYQLMYLIPTTESSKGIIRICMEGSSITLCI